MAKLLVAGTGGGVALLPFWQGRGVGTQARDWAELGLALTSIGV